MWQPRVEIIPCVLQPCYHIRSAVAQNFCGVGLIRAAKMHEYLISVWAMPLMEVLHYSTMNTIMQSKYTKEFLPRTATSEVETSWSVLINQGVLISECPLREVPLYTCRLEQMYMYTDTYTKRLLIGGTPHGYKSLRVYWLWWYTSCGFIGKPDPMYSLLYI